MHQGAALQLLLQEITQDIERAQQHDQIAGYAKQLAEACELATTTTLTLTQTAMEGKIDLFLANASVYLEMMGHIVIAWMWLKQAITATQRLDQSTLAQKVFYQGKLQACRYFYRWELPTIQPKAALLQSLDDTCLQVAPDTF